MNCVWQGALLEKSHVVAVKISLVAVIIDTIDIIVADFLSLNFCHYIFVPNDYSSGFIAATTIIVVSPSTVTTSIIRYLKKIMLLQLNLLLRDTSSKIYVTTIFATNKTSKPPSIVATWLLLQH
jgi:hypothetical protein